MSLSGGLSAGLGGGLNRLGGGGQSSTSDTTIYMILVIGQSNANGDPGGATVALSTTPPAVTPTPLRFVGSTRPGSIAGGTASLVDLYEQYDGGTGGSIFGGETVCWGMGRKLSILTGKTFLFSVAALSSAEYSGIKKGTATYDRGIAEVTAGKSRADELGRPFRVLCLAALHGETDQTNSRTNYAASLAEWQADFDADIKAITGQSQDIPLFACQQAGYSPSVASPIGAASALSLATAWKANPSKVILVGSRSDYPGQQDTGSTIHLSRWAYRWHGERQYADAIYRHFWGDGWSPVYPTSVNFSSGPGGAPTNTIVVNFTAPTSPLRWDFRNVFANRQTGTFYGFSYTDDTSPPSITAASITGDLQVTFTLSGTPTGTAASRFLRCGWGAQSYWQGVGQNNLVDSTSGTAFNGEPLAHRCCVFREQVT